MGLWQDFSDHGRCDHEGRPPMRISIAKPPIVAKYAFGL